MGSRSEEWPDRNPRSTKDNTLIKFVISILKYYSKVSSERFFKIAFLAEYFHYSKHNERISSAEYKLVLDGVHSKDLDDALSNINDVERTEVTISGETVKTIKVLREFQNKLSKDESESVEYIISNYGTVSPKEIDEVIQGLSVYQRTKLGDVLTIE